MDDLTEENNKLKECLTKINEKILTKWTGETFERMVSNLQSKHQQLLNEGQDEVLQHQQNVKRMEQLSSSNLKELEERVDKLQELKTSLQTLHSETDNLLHMKENAATQLGTESKQILKEKEYLLLQGKATQEKLMELDKAAAMFHDRLGFTFKKTAGGRLQCVFRSIDRDDPEAAFYFFIKVEGEDRHYTVSDCEPPVPEIDVLVEKLNKTNNLQSFIVCMRKKFQQIIQQQKNQK